MATFNAINFLRSTNALKTTVKTDDGITTTLKGMPKAYTAHGLATLAEKNDKVKVSLRQVEVTDKVKAKSAGSLSGEQAAKLLRGVIGAQVEEGDTTAETNYQAANV